MNKEKITTLAHMSILIAAATAAAYLGVKFLLPVILPFLIAWAGAFITRKPADFIAKKLHMPKKLLRASLSVLVIVAVVGAVVFSVVKIAAEAWNFLNDFTADGRLGEIIDRFISKISAVFGNIGSADKLEESLTGAAMSILSGLLGNAGGIVSFLAGGLPKIILLVIITSISSVYFAIDLENVNNYIHNLLPDKLDKMLVSFKNTSLKVAVKYMRSYLIIMLLIFSVMFFGFSVLAVRYALLMAIIVALLDLLPIIGIGTVLIPWGVFCLITNEVRLGIGLLILYAVGMVLREAVEPRIVGRELGIHPLLTLILMYIGYSFLGLFGLLFVPVFSVALKSFFEKKSTAEVEE